MKRLLILALSLCLLAGCGARPEAPAEPAGSQPEQFVFNRENFPRLNCRTN